MESTMGLKPAPTPGLEELLLLGDPGLRLISDPVENATDPQVAAILGRLRTCLSAFRGEHGFGRSIAAPQIGDPVRILALDVKDGPAVIINPEVTCPPSSEILELWHQQSPTSGGSGGTVERYGHTRRELHAGVRSPRCRQRFP